MQSKRNLRKERTGSVVSAKPHKTIIVRVTRQVKHPLYRKYIKKSSKFVAHDPDNSCAVGDMVKIAETRPLSKNKRWRLLQIFKQANPPS